MASMQCQKPVDHNTMVCQKTTTESKANHGQSLTDKVKEMAHSATKMFEHKNNQQNSGQHCHLHQTPTEHGVTKTHTSANHQTHAKSNHAQQSAACHCPGTTHEKKEGHGGNFLANIGENIKNMTSRRKNKKNRADNCNNSSSSSDESDNETCEKKNCV